MSQRVAVSDVADLPAEGERAHQLRQLTFHNFLSYGPEGTEFTFGSLNVLVGPNGSGKTNLIEALRVLRSSTTGFGATMRSGGGVEAYVWHGYPETTSATLSAVLELSFDTVQFRHDISFSSYLGRPDVESETIRRYSHSEPLLALPLFKRAEVEDPTALARDLEANNRYYEVHVSSLRQDESGIEKRSDHDIYPWLAKIADFYDSIAIFGEWTIGRGAVPRRPVLPGSESDSLLEDASNLAFVLAELRSTKALPKIRAALRRLKATYEDFSIRPVGGQLQLFVEEEGVVGGINAMRLSDGTLRFLALAAVLLHPKPPALVVIDEPELGMHPDLVEAIAEMIAEAATRTQLIVATHSPDLLSHLRGSVDRLYAFQAGPEGTSVRGFSREQLDAYLVDQPLGELWRQGDFGGNRF